MSGEEPHSPGETEEMDDKPADEVNLPSADPLVGRIFAEKYEVESLIGQGGMSYVYKVRHIHLGTTLALKVLHKHLWSDPLAVDRFRQEAKSINEIKHKNIIEYRDYGIYDGQPYLIMTYLQGETLEKRIKETGGLPVSKVVDIIEALSNGLNVAHKAGIIHRDIKPANVIFQSAEVEDVILVDFGIAKDLEKDPTRQLTQTGEIFGSPPYMSPEQCQGFALDQRTDIYSLGCLMYEALTGRPPIVGNNLLEIIKRQISEIPEPPSKVKPELVASRDKGIRFSDVEYVVMRCLEKERNERYSSLDNLLRDIQVIQSRNTIKKKTITKRVARQHVRRFIIFCLILSPVIFFTGYFLNKGFHYFTDRGITHASCLARLWISDIGIHLGNYSYARSLLNGALVDANRQIDREDKHNLKVDILLRFATMYRKEGNQRKQNEIESEIIKEIKSHSETKPEIKQN